MLKKIIILEICILSILCYSCKNNYNTELKYISFNIRNCRVNDGENSWLNRKQATLTMLKTECPNVFGIQDASIEQLIFIEDNMPQYTRIGVGCEDGIDKGVYSAVFFLKNNYQMLDNGNFWLSENPSKPSFGWDANKIRIVSWVHLKDIYTNKNFYIFNTQIDNIGKIAREQSIKLIINKIKEITYDKKTTVILSGDFQSSIEESIFEILNNYMIDSRKNANTTDDFPTFNNFGNDDNYVTDKIIDYIFIKNAQILSYKTLNNDYGARYISNHYPIEINIIF